MAVTFFETQVPFAKTGIPISLSQKQIDEMFKRAMNTASEELKERKVSVVFIEYANQQPISSPIDYNCDLLLGIVQNGQTEPIDIFELKALDGQSIKTEKDLADEIVKKVEQHLIAKKTKGILFSASGSKFDTRKLDEKWRFGIDEKGYLTIAGHRLASKSINDRYNPTLAESINSYTVIRLVFEEPNKIRLLDEYDLVHNQSCMYINVEKTHDIAASKIVKRKRVDAANYQGDGYYLLERDVLTHDRKKALSKVLMTFPLLGQTKGV